MLIDILDDWHLEDLEVWPAGSAGMCTLEYRHGHALLSSCGSAMTDLTRDRVCVVKIAQAAYVKRGFCSRLPPRAARTPVSSDGMR
jgi:hypothetical protein